MGTYDDLIGEFAIIVGEQLELAGATHVQGTIVEECQHRIEAVDICAQREYIQLFREEVDEDLANTQVYDPQETTNFAQWVKNNIQTRGYIQRKLLKNEEKDDPANDEA